MEGLGDWVERVLENAASVYSNIKTAKINAQAQVQAQQVQATASKSKQWLYLGIGVVGAALLIGLVKKASSSAA